MSQNVPFFDAPPAATRGSCEVKTILHQKYIIFTLKNLEMHLLYINITSLISFFILITSKIHHYENAKIQSH
ncbi:hypothetical protein CJJ19_11375 (plasmid) [Candidatus Williamhamiltonella defendens]|nr:hypothetical protein CJJ19_11375 [Candidatus Hamiltonella defensa]